MSQVFSRDFQQLKILSVKEPSTCFYEIEATIPCCNLEKITTTTQVTQNFSFDSYYLIANFRFIISNNTFFFQEPESPVVFSTTKATTTKITIENENIVPEKCVNCLTTGMTTDGQNCHDYQPCVEWGKNSALSDKNLSKVI